MIIKDVGNSGKSAAGSRRFSFLRPRRKETDLAKQVSRSITFRYCLALSVIAMLTIVSHYLVGKIVHEQGAFSRTVNLSARQQMLSQKVAALVMRLVRTKNAQERKSIREELKAATDLLRQSHFSLTLGDAALGLTSKPTKKVWQMYFGKPLNLHNQVRSYLENLEIIIAIDEYKHVEQDYPAVVAVTNQFSGKLLNSLGAMVQQYQDEAGFANAKIGSALDLVLFATFVILFGVAFLIFSPMVARVEASTAELLKTKEELNYSATHDALTALPNRRLCHERLDDALVKAGADNKKVGVFHLDLDGFKGVNDTLGHAAGDDLLVRVSDKLKQLSDDNCTVARVGGDEFVVIAPDKTDDREFESIAENVLDEFKSYFRLSDGTSVDVGTSIGFSCYPDHSDRAEDLLINADLALYKAKESGRGKYVRFRSFMREEFEEKNALVQKLQRAIKYDDFLVYYQPQIHIESGRVAGIEALVRWNDPNKGVRSPGEFLEVAESSGLTNAIGQSVLDKAVKAAAGWHHAGLEFGRIGLNIASSQLRNTRLIDLILDALFEYDLPPSLIAIEILEDAIISGNSKNLRAMMDEFNDLDIKVEFDDFGTGYASLVHLQNLPVNRLKIDRSFVIDICECEENRKIIQGMIDIAKGMELEVIAEGIETMEQAEMLSSWGCAYGQGYLYGKPMPEKMFTEFLKAKQPGKLIADYSERKAG